MGPLTFSKPEFSKIFVSQLLTALLPPLPAARPACCEDYHSNLGASPCQHPGNNYVSMPLSVRSPPLRGRADGPVSVGAVMAAPDPGEAVTKLLRNVGG